MKKLSPAISEFLTVVEGEGGVDYALTDCTDDGLLDRIEEEAPKLGKLLRRLQKDLNRVNDMLAEYEYPEVDSGEESED